MANRLDDLAKVWTASTTGEGAAARARDVTARRPHRAIPADGADRRPVGRKGSPWAIVLGIGGEATADQASRRAVPDRRIVALAPSRDGRVRLRFNGHRRRRCARSECHEWVLPPNPDDTLIKALARAHQHGCTAGGWQSGGRVSGALSQIGGQDLFDRSRRDTELRECQCIRTDHIIAFHQDDLVAGNWAVRQSRQHGS